MNDVALRAFRFERNRLLAECDWTQLEDAPLTRERKREWAAYRHALRRLPQLDGFNAAQPEWPTPPAVGDGAPAGPDGRGY
jgi:hypothetical protein